MDKRSSSTAGAAAGATTKKSKTGDVDASVVGRWVQTKARDKELSQAEKLGLLKNTPVESLAAGPEIIPRPPPGFRVILSPFCCGVCLFLRILSSAAFYLHTGFSSMT
jgi:hypothetical protein